MARAQWSIAARLAVFPKTGHRIHVNVLDLDRHQHSVINRKRRNIFDLVEYLRSEGLLYSANHLFQSYRMRQAPEVFFETMLSLFDIFEVPTSRSMKMIGTSRMRMCLHHAR